MMRNSRSRTFLAAGCAVAATLVGAPALAGSDATVSSADPREVYGGDDLDLTQAQKAELDDRAAEVLRGSKPGGERVAPDTIIWDEGDVVLTLAIDGKAREYSTPAARDGNVYLYDGIYFNGDRLALDACRFEKLRWYNWTNKTSSWKNNQYGNPIAKVYYWDGHSVIHLDAGPPGYSTSFQTYQTNIVDFVRPCR